MATYQVFRDDPMSLLDEHAPYMSDADEAEIIRLVGDSDDVADLAVRTCVCGRSLNGFEDYFNHLRSLLAGQSVGDA